MTRTELIAEVTKRIEAATPDGDVSLDAIQELSGTLEGFFEDLEDELGSDEDED